MHLVDASIINRIYTKVQVAFIHIVVAAMSRCLNTRSNKYTTTGIQRLAQIDAGCWRQATTGLPVWFRRGRIIPGILQGT